MNVLKLRAAAEVEARAEAAMRVALEALKKTLEASKASNEDLLGSPSLLPLPASSSSTHDNSSLAAPPNIPDAPAVNPVTSNNVPEAPTRDDPSLAASPTIPDAPTVSPVTSNNVPEAPTHGRQRTLTAAGKARAEEVARKEAERLERQRKKADTKIPVKTKKQQGPAATTKHGAAKNSKKKK